jgi:hypothetical protein
MFYIDRDELLSCPPPAAVTAGNATFTMNDSLDDQAATQHAVIDYYTARGFDRLSFQRFAYAARLPSDLQDSQSESVRASLMDKHVPDCLREGYAARSMSQLWGCWGGRYERQKQFKSGDVRLGLVCPFVGLHEPCLRYLLPCLCAGC